MFRFGIILALIVAGECHRNIKRRQETGPNYDYLGGIKDCVDAYRISVGVCVGEFTESQMETAQTALESQLSTGSFGDFGYNSIAMYGTGRSSGAYTAAEMAAKVCAALEVGGDNYWTNLFNDASYSDYGVGFKMDGLYTRTTYLFKMEDENRACSGSGQAAPATPAPAPVTTAAPVPSAVSGPAPAWLTACRQNALARHNTLRSQHGSPAMTADTELDNVAQNWAEHLANVVGKMEHSTQAQRTLSRGYAGENLATGWYSSGPGVYTTADLAAKGTSSVQAWYDELPFYDAATCSSTDSNEAVGHFTQVVWKESTLLGTGCAITPDSKAYYIVSNYLEGGNVRWGGSGGECKFYTENVVV